MVTFRKTKNYVYKLIESKKKFVCIGGGEGGGVN
jgi:hypothetical protein